MGNHWHKRYHSDALAGMLTLTLEERGAYQTILDLIYDRGGPVPDNERLLSGYMGCSIRKWRTLRASLIAAGKLALIDGYLTNFRAEKEIENALKTARKHAENGAKGGRKSAENREKSNENNGSGQAWLETGSTILEARSQKLDKEREEEPPHSPPVEPHPALAFAGRFIRVSRSDFDKWRGAYPAILDLRAELTALDDWFRGAPQHKRENWYSVTSASLSRKHREALAEQRRLEREDDDEFGLIGPC
ncbi:DUF1376 domain-containing protein [Erythrobacteraceae bacterium CFH 75059]|uniref:DUF1376 domain-containing protein n=1 Tax=Qipengyuania thermophila TaxID=2509361 RepID=UPI0010225B84|nr:DUF1376 domain-containing protein [Qipengyuania thermophila]TCD00714.1 DUF1376 domain-containing protein [Erythrobacteraceae bacterium CFH 75059]